MVGTSLLICLYIYSLRLKIPYIHCIRYRKYWQAKEWKPVIFTMQKHNKTLRTFGYISFLSCMRGGVCVIMIERQDLSIFEYVDEDMLAMIVIINIQMQCLLLPHAL